MKAGNEFNHFCGDQEEQTFFLYSLKDKTTRKFELPYESMYLLDSIQVNNQIYFTGGGLPPGDKGPDKYYPQTMRVTFQPNFDYMNEKLANMNTARANHTMAYINPTLVYVVGGSNLTGELASCEEYKVSANKWREIATLNEKKMWVSVCNFAGRFLYAFGGSTKSDSSELDSIESLDTSDAAAKKWTLVKLAKGKEMWKKCFFAGCYQIDMDTLLIFGGLGNKSEVEEAYCFFPKHNAISKGPKLMRPDAFSRSKPGIFNNELVVVGTSECDLHVFNIPEKKWRLIKKSAWNPDEQMEIKSATL